MTAILILVLLLAIALAAPLFGGDTRSRQRLDAGQRRPPAVGQRYLP